MPHPENHSVARQHPRHRHDPSTADTLGLGLFTSAVLPCHYVSSTPARRRSSTSTCRSPDRRDGKVRVSYRLAARRAGRRCSSPPTGCRRSTGSSPASRTRARCSTSSPRGGSSAPSSIIANHVVDVPDPNVLVATRDRAAAGGGDRARRDHRRHVDVAVAAVRRRRADDLRLPLPRRAAEEHAAARADRDADHQAAGRVGRATTSRSRGPRSSTAGSSSGEWEQVTSAALDCSPRVSGSPPRPV